eukprot:909728-Amphidinium_carterae.6
MPHVLDHALRSYQKYAEVSSVTVTEYVFAAIVAQVRPTHRSANDRPDSTIALFEWTACAVGAAVADLAFLLNLEHDIIARTRKTCPIVRTRTTCFHIKVFISTSSTTVTFARTRTTRLGTKALIMTSSTTVPVSRTCTTCFVTKVLIATSSTTVSIARICTIRVSRPERVL